MSSRNLKLGHNRHDAIPFPFYPCGCETPGKIAINLPILPASFSSITVDPQLSIPLVLSRNVVVTFLSSSNIFLSILPALSRNYSKLSKSPLPLPPYSCRRETGLSFHFTNIVAKPRGVRFDFPFHQCRRETGDVAVSMVAKLYFHFTHVVAKLPTSWASSPYFHFTHVVAKQADGSQSTEAFHFTRVVAKRVLHDALPNPDPLSILPMSSRNPLPLPCFCPTIKYFHFTHVVAKRQSLTSTSTVFHFTHVVAKLRALP
jgi:hypothetical protein